MRGPHDIFGIVQFKDNHARDLKTSFLVCGGMGGSDAATETTRHFLPLCSSKTPILGIQKRSFWPMVCRGMGAWGATPETTRYFLASCSSKTPILGIQKHSFWPRLCSCMAGLGRHTRTHTIFSGIVQFKDTHPRDPKTSFPAYGVQKFWVVVAPSHNSQIFSGIV